MGLGAAELQDLMWLQQPGAGCPQEGAVPVEGTPGLVVFFPWPRGTALLVSVVISGQRRYVAGTGLLGFVQFSCF